jgi:hypothetical protein
MNRSRIATIAILLALFLITPLQAEVIQLRSGQVGGLPGLPGQPDDIVTWGQFVAVGLGPLSAVPFTAANFNAAAAFPATVVSHLTTPWFATLPSDPLARWINYDGYAPDPTFPITGSFGSVLYRVPFTVSTVGITNAQLSIHWAVDDFLGDPAGSGPNPVGAYLRDGGGNVTLLPPVVGGFYNIETQANGINVTSAITTGANELFLYQRDNGAVVSGTIFSATFDINIIPEPAAIALTAIAALGLLSWRQKVVGTHRAP